MLRPAAFLDRDGVLNVDSGYLFRSQNLVWIEGAAKAVARLNAAGYLVFVVTNQSGIARDLYSADEMHALHRFMAYELGRSGGKIDAFYHCPHHPEHGPVRDCRCRKPSPGMLEAAFRDWPVDRSQSFMIGDRPTDLEAAAAAGLPGHQFSGGDLDHFIAKLLVN